MIFDPAKTPLRERYRLMIGSVLPRPIAWVSTQDEQGVLNLAPFSFFTGVCMEPMTLLFCPGVPSRTESRKHTLRNIEAVGEFVVNLPNVDTAEAMNLCATDFPPEESEFEWAGVTPAASEAISVPRVAEAPIAYECTLQKVVTVSEKPGGGFAVFGEVVRLHVRDDLMVDGTIDIGKYRPIGRLGGDSYTAIKETFEMARVPVSERSA